MKIITFNGLGQPQDPQFGTGTIALLVQRDAIDIVRIQLLGPDEIGPELEHARNGADLANAARQVIAQHFPQGLSPAQHWLIECPVELARQARF